MKISNETVIEPPTIVEPIKPPESGVKEEKQIKETDPVADFMSGKYDVNGNLISDETDSEPEEEQSSTEQKKEDSETGKEQSISDEIKLKIIAEYEQKLLKDTGFDSVENIVKTVKHAHTSIRERSETINILETEKKELETNLQKALDNLKTASTKEEIKAATEEVKEANEELSKHFDADTAKVISDAIKNQISKIQLPKSDEDSLTKLLEKVESLEKKQAESDKMKNEAKAYEKKVNNFNSAMIEYAQTNPISVEQEKKIREYINSERGSRFAAVLDLKYGNDIEAITESKNVIEDIDNILKGKNLENIVKEREKAIKEKFNIKLNEVDTGKATVEPVGTIAPSVTIKKLTDDELTKLFLEKGVIIPNMIKIKELNAIGKDYSHLIPK